jgi:hypothetical protein
VTLALIALTGCDTSAPVLPDPPAEAVVPGAVRVEAEDFYRARGHVADVFDWALETVDGEQLLAQAEPGVARAMSLLELNSLGKTGEAPSAVVAVPESDGETSHYVLSVATDTPVALGKSGVTAWLAYDPDVFLHTETGTLTYPFSFEASAMDGSGATTTVTAYAPGDFRMDGLGKGAADAQLFFVEATPMLATEPCEEDPFVIVPPDCGGGGGAAPAVEQAAAPAGAAPRIRSATSRWKP